MSRGGTQGTLLARIRWFSPDRGGRACLPVGSGFSPDLRVVDEDLSTDSSVNTRIAVELLDVPEDVAFETPYEQKLRIWKHGEAMAYRLIPGSRVEIFEGPRVIGSGTVVAVG